MNRILFLTGILASLLQGAALAQPTFRLSPAQVVANEGDQVCLSMEVDNFTDILSASFTLQWDPGVLTFQQVTNINSQVTALDLSDFDLSMTDEGIVTLDWSNLQPCNTATTGVTLFPDGQTVFDICFVATTVYGKHTFVEITDSPMDIVVKRVSSNCNDIGDFVQNSFVSVGTNPLTINISSGDGFTGDVVCLDFEVEDFDNIVSFEFAVFWDTAVLQYNSHLTMGLTGNYFIGETQTAQGILNALFYNSNLSSGVSLTDGTQILQACFDIIGDCGQSSPVYIDGNHPVPIEVINAVTSDPNSGVNIGLLQQEGEVTVNCFNPDGITVDVEDKAVCPGETFTVDVTVSDFTTIAKLVFNLKWNPGVIDLTDITYPQSASCAPFSNGVTQPEPGRISMDWTSFGLGCTLPDDFILMRLHFTAVGASGTNTTIAVVNPILVDKFGGQVVNIGINNNNGQVSICELSYPTIAVSSGSGTPGEDVCVDFTVQDFDDITAMQFTVTWEPSVLSFTGVGNLSLPGLDAGSFLTAQAGSIGVVGVDWSSPGGVSQPDGSTLFSMCFQVVGDPDQCTEVSIQEVPWPVNIETTTSNNTDVGLNGQPGQVCVDNPFIFELSFPNLFGGLGSSLCMAVKVKNFNQLTHTLYTINWNPEILDFQDIVPTGTLPNFTAGSYDASPALVSNGQLVIDWTSNNQIQGTTLPDGTTVFQLCFVITGLPGECSQITASGFPAGITVNSAITGNANLNLAPSAGSVCVNAVLSLLDAVITPVECPSDPQGAIDLSVVGGSGNYLYNWAGPDVVPSSQDQTGLDVGTYLVTVTDVSNPTLKLELDFSVGYAPTGTLAHAGVDTSFSCADFPFITLNGNASLFDPAQDVTLLWQGVTGSGIIVDGQGTTSPKVVGGTCWRLTVTNNTTGCVDRDTVCVSSPQIPVPEAGESVMITCFADTVLLNGTQSPAGFTPLWTTGPGGGNIVAGTETGLTPLVTASGWYFLTQTSPQSGCQGTDSVFVEVDITAPEADAGPTAGLGCNDVEVGIGGPGTSVGTNISYQWNTLISGEICGSPNAAATTACGPGIYQLVVTNQDNGCTAQSQVQVLADTLKPTAVAGPGGILDCTVTSLTLNATGSSAGPNYQYHWSGGNVVSGSNTLQPTVGAAGTYQLEVTDTTNGCKAFSNVVVTQDTLTPAAVADASNDITCLLTQALLDAGGSSVGNNYSYQWLDGDLLPVSTDSAVTVSTPGTYTLVVTNQDNGCTQTAAVSVLDQTVPPAVEAGTDMFINCFGNPQLQGSAANPTNLILNWAGPGLGCITGNGSFVPVVSCPGTYTLTVQDTVTGCVNTDQVEVQEDKVPPVVDAGADTALTCLHPVIDLPGSSDVSDGMVSWTSVPAGLPIQNPGSLQATVQQAGTYALTVTSNVNGCSKTDLVVVAEDFEQPVADAGQADSTDCVQASVSLSAEASTLANATVQWTALSGSIDPGQAGEVVVQVPAGTYVLTVTYQDNGCEASDTVTVVDNAIVPVVGMAPVWEIGCLQDTLAIPAEVVGAQPGFIYTWTDADGAVLSSADILPVDGPGTFSLTVFNPANNCGSDPFPFEVLPANDGPAATAQADYVDCDPFVFLLGNLPSGATGQWVSATGAVFDAPQSESTFAAGLVAGENTFTWILSLGNCPQYDSASASIVAGQTVPMARDDQADMAGTDSQLAVDVLQNDLFSSISFAIVDRQPANYGLVFTDSLGVIRFEREPCQAGTMEIAYAICDLVCPELCDTAVLTIDIEANPEADCDKVPNGITPNGDGVNDELVFDVLLNNPQDAFPDNEIVIFNRWGDVVYQAKPYQNDWRGTNNTGKDLPQGTYYYILRLSLADGDIIRGDVTILK
ncbi:MAG: hypothetical protein RLY31_430 [Bacteroidota bacterium]